MKYKKNAIETEYKGYVFRSRLEARWAAFFDLMKWNWEYEPCDFNGWIPDFVIFGSREIYVEIKPVSCFCEHVANKIDNSGCNDEVVIFGMTLQQKKEKAIVGCDGICIGWIREYGSWWQECMLTDTVEIKTRFVDGMGNDVVAYQETYPVIGFNAYEGDWTNRISGENNHSGGCSSSSSIDIANVNWAKAHYITRWTR